VSWRRASNGRRACGVSLVNRHGPVSARLSFRRNRRKKTEVDQPVGFAAEKPIFKVEHPLFLFFPERRPSWSKKHGQVDHSRPRVIVSPGAGKYSGTPIRQSPASVVRSAELFLTIRFHQNILRWTDQDPFDAVLIDIVFGPSAGGVWKRGFVDQNLDRLAGFCIVGRLAGRTT